MTLRTLNYGNYGIFLIMGNAGFCPSTVSVLAPSDQTELKPLTKAMNQRMTPSSAAPFELTVIRVKQKFPEP